MSFLDRALALQNRKHRLTVGSSKTVHLEQVETSGATDYRATTSAVLLSIQLDPAPIVRLLNEDDISEVGENVGLGDYLFEIPGNSVTEDQLRKATRIVLNKGLPDEEKMQIEQIRVGKILSTRLGSGGTLFVIGGQPIIWNIYARSTKKAF